MADAPGRGGMAAVLAGREQVESLLDARLELAALNSPSNTVVTGPLDALAELGERARARGIRVVPLDVSHAFHSRLMDPVLAPFTALVERVPLHRPSIPIVSNVTGTWIDEELTRPSYWARQLRSCVAFAPGLDALAARDIDVLIEVGPSDTLAKLAVATLGERVLALASLRRGHDEADSLLASVGALWQRGVELRVEELLDAGALVDLPPYPFEREVHRLEFTTAPATSRPATTQAEMILAQLRARDITLGQALVRLGRAGTTP
jgi:phthiocerol/phenolphthiocerol synthesis type-I polyketide synthase E